MRKCSKGSYAWQVKHDTELTEASWGTPWCHVLSTWWSLSGSSASAVAAWRAYQSKTPPMGPALFPQASALAGLPQPWSALLEPKDVQKRLKHSRVLEILKQSIVQTMKSDWPKSILLLAFVEPPTSLKYHTISCLVMVSSPSNGITLLAILAGLPCSKAVY